MRVVLLMVMACVLSGCFTLADFVANSVNHLHDTTAMKNLVYAPKQHQRMDEYHPNHSRRYEVPIIMFVHGGNWQDGSKETYAYLGHHFAEMGYRVVIPDYAKYPQQGLDGMLTDLVKAIQHVSGTTFGAANPPIYLMGHSAGAHLAALLLVRQEYFKKYHVNPKVIAGFVGLAGPYDFTPTDPTLQQLFGPPEKYPLMQAGHFVRGDEPPMLLLAGGDDDLVGIENLEKLRDAILAKGGKVETKIYPELDHLDMVGVFSWLLDHKAPVSQDIDRFLRAHGAKPEPKP